MGAIFGRGQDVNDDDDNKSRWLGDLALVFGCSNGLGSPYHAHSFVQDGNISNNNPKSIRHISIMIYQNGLKLCVMICESKEALDVLVGEMKLGPERIMLEEKTGLYSHFSYLQDDIKHIIDYIMKHSSVHPDTVEFHKIMMYELENGFNPEFSIPDDNDNNTNNDSKESYSWRQI